jgi:hypothetical protein
MYSCLEFGLDPLGVSVPQAFTHHLSNKVGLISSVLVCSLCLKRNLKGKSHEKKSLFPVFTQVLVEKMCILR